MCPPHHKRYIVPWSHPQFLRQGYESVERSTAGKVNQTKTHGTLSRPPHSQASMFLIAEFFLPSRFPGRKFGNFPSLKLKYAPPPPAPVFEHLVPSLWCCFGSLWNLLRGEAGLVQETLGGRQAFKGDGSILIQKDTNKLCYKLLLPQRSSCRRALSPTMMDYALKP